MSISAALSVVDPVTSARDVAVVVRECAEESERIGTMAPRAVDVLRESGLPWLGFPVELGGMGGDITKVIEVTEVLSNADGSAGWTYMVNAGGAMMTGFFCSDEAYEDAFAGPDLPFCAGVAAPTGVVTPVEGGWMATGQWSFASGSLHSDWLMCRMVNVELSPEAQANQFIAYMFPRSEVEFRGNWDVMGLQGTGSVDFAIKDLFIPAHRAVDMLQSAKRGGINGRLGTGVIGLGGHIGVPIGIASRALEEITSYAAIKTRTGQTGLLCDADLFRAGFAMHEASFQAMRGLVYETFAAALRRINSGGTIDAASEQRIRQVTTYAHDVAEEIVRFCFEWGAGRAFRNPSALGRCMRDIMVARQHIIIDRHTMVRAAAPLLERWSQGPQTIFDPI